MPQEEKAHMFVLLIVIVLIGSAILAWAELVHRMLER
jgi:hypothetical protein